MAETGLYERAASSAHELCPLWHMGDGKAIFAGPLEHNANHAHNVTVYVAGLHGKFGMRIRGGDWHSCRTAVIPAGVPYEFDVGGNPISVFYVEPAVASAKALVPLVRNSFEENGAVIGTGGEIALMREFYEDETSAGWAGPALDDLLEFTERKTPGNLDPRISRVVRYLYTHYGDYAPVAQVAARPVCRHPGSSTCSPGKWACRFGGSAAGAECASPSKRSSRAATSPRPLTPPVMRTSRILRITSGRPSVRPHLRAF